ncbi:PREDICTED: hemicentin-1-like [Amphimedon queenslandica]|uniref:Uncharacterized protein n=2 Tax=Amphimedon queenslandica TaxID=400682 RepID=A0AAN0J8P8_AMPQE|nr:PREDICTED: hemicentin-1-like [Amphimedon queenslandica]|eukprot:XP_019853400.1 PREDICTED: hemicentin-1-like [Amphimedon queenslandica]
METLLPPTTLQSVLVFSNGLKTDESIYTCIGINNIINIIQSPEQDNITLLVQVPVEIVDNPVNTTHYAGGNVTLSCNASGIPLPTFQWYKNNQLITPNDRVYLTTLIHIETLIESLVESVLVFNNIVLSDDDNYHCQATNPGAHDRIFNVFSQSVRLTVQYPPNVTTLEPREIIINQTEPANFTCQAYGIPTPSINWINVSSGSIVQPVSGLIDIMETLLPPTTLQSVLVFSNGLKTDESIYTCIGINNIINIIQSPEQDNITLLVQVPVEIVDNPVNTTHYAGGNVTLSCNASGIPLPTFQWYKNNQLITPNDRVYLTTLIHLETLIESLVESVLVFNNIVLSDDDNYHCQATNPGAHDRIFNVFSQSVRLTVHHPPNTTVTPSQIIVNSTAVSSITFTCYSFGIPPPSLRWIKEKGGALLMSLGPTQILGSSIDSSSTSVLTLFRPSDVDESNYTCIAVNNVTNVLGTPEDDVGELYVQDPVIIAEHPTSRTHPAGFPFIDLTCTATGLPVPSIYWYKDGVLLVDDGDHIQIRENDYEQSNFGINYGRLHIVDIVLSDDGDYVCVAINTGAPGITFNVSSQVAQISVQYPPLVNLSPSSLILNQTDSAVFTCNIFGIPRPTFNWLNGSTLLPFSPSSLYSITNTTDTYNITSVLTIFFTQRTDMGSYTCAASNGIDNLISSPEEDSVELFVQEPSQFLLEPFNTSNYTAGTITLSCQATGIPLPSISWFKDGQLVLSESDDRINITTLSFVTQNERNITSFLRIDSLVLSDTGYYHCSTSNEAASGTGIFSDRTETAYLFVQYPPVVSVSPTLTITNQTNSTSFNCSLFGVPTPTVTWTRIGSNDLPVSTLSPPGSDPFITTVVDGYNVTSVLLFNSSMATDEGGYVCAGRNDVFNAIGVPESASVSLFVQVPSLFITHPQSVTNYTAGSARLSCTVYGLPVPSILWLKDGEILAETDNLTITIRESFTDTTGQSVSVLSIVDLTLEDAGVYHCMANNTGALGNSFTVNSLAATLVVQYPPSLIISPVQMIVNQTDRVSITCTVFAVPHPQITWTDDREGTSIPLTPIQDIVSITETDSGNTRTSVLTFNSIVKLNESNYTCTAVNNVTNVINALDQGTSSITVQVRATVTSLVGFTLHRQNGDNATITFSLSEDSPLVKTENIRWFLRTVSSFEDITFRSDTRQTLSEDRLSLLIDGITETDEGEYILRATNEAGTGEGTVVISVAGPPAIISGPVNQKRIEGDSVTFSCFATGDPIPEVTWRFNNSLILTNNTKYSIGDITEGIEFGSLTINDLNYFDKGTYECTASNVNGTSSLDVLLEIQVVPVVTVHPLTQDVIAGGVVTLNCTAYGFPGINIKWLKNGVMITQDLIPESSIREERGSLPEDITVTSYLTIEDLQLRDVANYSCNVSNGLVEDRLEYSDNAELTVLYPPNVDVAPKSFIVNQTEPVNFTCTAYGIPPPKLTWYDTRNISEPLRLSRVLYVVEDLYTNITGFSLVESVLVFASALRTDASVYTCIATNDIENLLETPETGNAALYVQLPAFIQSSPPERVDHFRGGTTNISCSATGLPLPTITWFKDGSLLNLNDRIYVDEINETTPTSGFIMSTLVFQVLELADNGSYHCEANNTGAPGNEFLVPSESSFIFITHPPNVTVSPETQLTVNVTFTATITCSVFAIPLPRITWINNTDGSLVVGGGANRITITETDYTHIRISVLNFTSTVKFDESVYTCMAVNNISNVLDTPETKAVFLRIQVPASVTPVSPSPSFGVEGQSIVLTFSITQDDPLVNTSNIRWTFRGTAGLLDITETDNPHYELINERRSLVITQITSAHQGIYTLFATNEAGTRSNSINLQLQGPPVFYLLPSDQTLLEHSTVTFQCLAIGDPFPSVSWSFNDEILIQDSRYIIGDSGQDFGSLTISRIRFTDRGTYTCTYNNTHGTVMTSATLSVQVIPVIVDLAVPPNGTAGSDTVLTCISRGYPAPTISWFINDTLVAEQNNNKMSINVLTMEGVGGLYNVSSSLLINELELSDTNGYHCTATNELESVQTVTSPQLQFTVLYPPNITEPPVNKTINQTDDGVFNCTVFSIPLSTVNWFFNNTQLEDDGANDINIKSYSHSMDQYITSSLTVSNTLRANNEGWYTCTASNGVDNLIDAIEFSMSFLTVQVPPTVVSDSSTYLGVVHGSVTISFMILYASPVVNVTNIQWFFNDTRLTGSESNYNFSSDLLSLSISNLQHSDEGLYTLVASNEAGTNSTSVFLEIEAAPEIVLPPNNSSILEGDKVTFECRTTSEPLHTVQWFFEGTPIDTISSTPALVTINNVAQYVMTVSSTQDYQLLVNMMNQDIVGSNIYNDTLTIFSVQLHNTNDNSSTAAILVTVVIATEEGSGCPLRCREELVEFFNLRGSSFNPSFTVTDNITRFDGCESEVTNSTFNWSEVNIGSTLRIDCPCGGLSLGTGSPVAIRACTGSFTNGASWTEPNTIQCDLFTDDVLPLCNVTQMPTVESSIQSLQSLVSGNPNLLSSLQLAIAVSALERYIHDIPSNDNLTLSYVGVVTSLLGADLSIISEAQSQYNISSRITVGLERLTEVMSLLDQSNRTIDQPNLFVLSAESITTSSYSGSQFSVSEDSPVISLPPDLLIGYDFINRLLFSYYYNSRLTSVLFESESMSLSSSVLAASASGVKLTNLSTTVNISFGMVNSSQVACVYWDFTARDGRGDWSAQGCETVTHNGTITCLCNHLTHFALAQPTTVAPSSQSNPPATSKVLEVLEILSMICVGVSLLCITLSLLVHVFSRKLRIKPPIQLLVNVCVSLLLLYLMYIGALYARTQQNACIVFSYLFQYSFSVSLLALLGQMVSVVFLGLKSTFPIIISIISWVTPMFYIGLLSPFYSQTSNDKLCRPDKITAVMSLILPLSFASIIAVALGILMLIRWFITRGEDSTGKRPRGTARRHLILFGIFVAGWLFGLLRTLPDLQTTTYIIFESLFIITGALFGLHFFVLHCLLVYEVRVCFKRVFYKITCQEYTEQDDEPGSRRGTMTPESFVLAKSLAEKKDPGNIEMTDHIYSVPNKKRSAKEKQKEKTSGYVKDNRTGYVHSLKEIQDVKANLGRLDSELSSPARSEDSGTDLPVAKFPSVAFASNEKLDSSAIDQPDPDEETEL